MQFLTCDRDMQSTLKSTVDGFSQAWQRPPVLHPSAGHARPVSMSVSVSEHIPSPSSTFSRSSGGQSVHDPSRDPRLEGHQPVLIEPARIDKPSPASEQNYSRPSERSESGADNDALADPDMDALRNRGKGTYTCKYGMSCTKGGVDMHGQLVIFERNCMFRSVVALWPIVSSLSSSLTRSTDNTWTSIKSHINVRSPAALTRMGLPGKTSLSDTCRMSSTMFHDRG